MMGVSIHYMYGYINIVNAYEIIKSLFAIWQTINA